VATVREERKAQDFWIHFKEEFDQWEKEREAKRDAKYRNALLTIADLENRLLRLSKRFVELEARVRPVAELMGWYKAEKK
jgi:hypothetical protein